jgi:hypothetical protein
MVMAVALLLSGCVTGVLTSLGTSNWKEEVELHDGSKIVVDRYQNYGGAHAIGQGAPIRTQEIRFVMPGKHWPISFKSEYSDDVGRANLKIIALHILNDVPYIVTVPNLCIAYNKWGRPNPPYVIFKHDGKDWQRIPLEELPAAFKTINLAIDTKHEEERFRKDGVFSAEQVRKFNKQLSQKEYASILREPLPRPYISNMCMEMIPYKGSWVMPNDEIGKSFIDQQVR